MSELPGWDLRMSSGRLNYSSVGWGLFGVCRRKWCCIVRRLGLDVCLS